MLLALWSDFWNPAAWVPPGPQPEPPDGGSRGAGHGEVDDYVEYPAIPDSADESYWREREIYLRRQIPVRIEPDAESGPEVKKLVQQHNRIVDADPYIPASNLPQLSKKLDDLTLQIKRLESDSDDEAIIALLLS